MGSNAAARRPGNQQASSERGGDSEETLCAPAAMAKAMIDAGHAVIAHQNIRLIAAASTQAQLIGPPTEQYLLKFS